MNLPDDQSQRDRFREDLETNFSVIAAAGSGKTYAITNRIARIAQHPQARTWLPQLVVVTFTHRAADEMQRRARRAILESRVALDVVAAFDRAFFGTIHSFCVKLLNDYGHYLGLPPRLDLITDDAELWHDFVQNYTSLGGNLPEQIRRMLFRHVPVRQLMELGRRGNFDLPDYKDLGPPPKLDFSAVYKVKAKQSRSIEKIERDQAELRMWKGNYDADGNYLPLIECTSAAQEFTAAWDAAFGPFRKWLTNAALAVAAEVQRAYRDFRVDHGVLTYDDQVALADSLFDLPTAAERIRSRDFRVILDEAQDTDPKQFSILIETTRPPSAHGRWLQTKQDPPRSGYFCMVGDRQQSIFGDRADLHQYQSIHDALVETKAGEALEFGVTFRLDQRQVEFINRTFPVLLNESEGQVAFLPLTARPTPLPGQIVRLDIDGDDTKTERQRADQESTHLAEWIKQTDLKRLRARCWSEVAILCPRKAWFRSLRDALRRAGFVVQTQSDSELNADNPAHAWLAALATIMARPRSNFEVVGVLREVFGLSDHDLAVFSEGKGTRFQIQFTHPPKSLVAQTLNGLIEIRETIQDAPLYQAVTQIVVRTHLRERLLRLPEADFGDLSNELDRLLVAAATAETDGKTLADFAADLRANFDTPRESDPPRREAIQLITGQKAKGSEWDCVILPFLSRIVRPRSPDYARIVRIPQTGELIVALGRDDMSKDVRDALKLADRQEMERLLYVALTRARHTLVLAFDEKLFHNARNASPSKSQASWLRAAAENSDPLNELTQSAEACADTEQMQARHAAEEKLHQEVAALPVVSRNTKSAALKTAGNFVRKVTPSLVARQIAALLPAAGADAWKEIEPEFRPLTIDNAATRYGKWWHDFIQRISWQTDDRSRQQTFEQWTPRSPDRSRSVHEWELLRQRMTLDPDMQDWIRDPDMVAHTEIPFFWPAGKDRCVEGVIDLALSSAGKNRWLIVDWKTNRIDEQETGLLREQYLPQIAAYWKAISEMTAAEVETKIYSTATGLFVEYDHAELAAEWQRLQTLSLNELREEIVENAENRA